MSKPLIVDSFAGGGGASTGIEIAFADPILTRSVRWPMEGCATLAKGGGE